MYFTPSAFLLRITQSWTYVLSSTGIGNIRDSSCTITYDTMPGLRIPGIVVYMLPATTGHLLTACNHLLDVVDDYWASLSSKLYLRADTLVFILH